MTGIFLLHLFITSVLFQPAFTFFFKLRRLTRVFKLQRHLFFTLTATDTDKKGENFKSEKTDACIVKIQKHDKGTIFGVRSADVQTMLASRTATIRPVLLVCLDQINYVVAPVRRARHVCALFRSKNHQTYQTAATLQPFYPAGNL